MGLPASGDSTLRGDGLCGSDPSTISLRLLTGCSSTLTVSSRPSESYAVKAPCLGCEPREHRLTSHWSRRPTAYAPASLRLLGAAHRQRWVAGRSRVVWHGPEKKQTLSDRPGAALPRPPVPGL